MTRYQVENYDPIPVKEQGGPKGKSPQYPAIKDAVISILRVFEFTLSPVFPMTEETKFTRYLIAETGQEAYAVAERMARAYNCALCRMWDLGVTYVSLPSRDEIAGAEAPL